MKERIINTRLWGDSWIRKLNPLDRYLFLYLLTNEHTNICGIYELPIATMAYESGLDERDLIKTMIPRLKPKVYHYNEWVILSNFLRYQHTKSESVVEGIKRSLNEAPESVVAYAYKIGYGDDLGIVPPPSHILNPNLTLTKLEPIPAETSSAMIPNLIKLFETINPTCKTYYGNVTQRKACEFLISTYGFEKVSKIVSELLPQTNGMEYMPTITTPIQLKDKWSQLEAGMKKERSKIKNKDNVYW